MKHARVIYEGREHTGTSHEWNGLPDAAVRLQDGRVVPQEHLTWLPPLAPTPRPRTILALGLNYADHAKELEFKAPEEPLVFVKGQATLTGHRQKTFRPAGVQFMHYECELAIVVGKTARKVKHEDAFDFIGGYTVANDYAIRDYLENWYRPNLRVKNRDGGTVLGPWFVDAADIATPVQLNLGTLVNGTQTQSGNTRDMIHDVASLIEYLSAFMTLGPGDVILTGTPKGSVDVKAGDEVVCEVEGVGRLVNRLVDDWTPAPGG